MKAFFSSIIKPKNDKQANAAAAAGDGNKNAAPSSDSAAYPAAILPPTDTATTGSDPNTTTTSSSSSNVVASTMPTKRSAPMISSVDRKLAKSAFDEWVGVMNQLFDHSKPVKNEVEFFLQQMEDWTERDPFGEMSKASTASRCINMELPITREKGTLRLQEINQQLQSTLSHTRDFFAVAEKNDAFRRSHSIPSLSRLQQLQQKLSEETAEKKSRARAEYVEAFRKLHEKYGVATAPEMTGANPNIAVAGGNSNREGSTVTAVSLPVASPATTDANVGQGTEEAKTDSSTNDQAAPATAATEPSTTINDAATADADADASAASATVTTSDAGDDPAMPNANEQDHDEPSPADDSVAESAQASKGARKNKKGGKGGKK